MSGPNLVPIIGYVVMTGGYDEEEGLGVYGGIVSESDAHANRDCDEAKRMGFDDAEVYMLVPADSIPRVGIQ